MRKITLTFDQVKKIARSAKLSFDNDSLTTITQELDHTVDYIKVLDELELQETDPTFQVTGLKNICSDDMVKPGLAVEQALSAGPRVNKNYFLVEAVLNE